MGINVPALGITQEGGCNPVGAWPFAAASAAVQHSLQENISPKFLKRSRHSLSTPCPEHKIFAFPIVSPCPLSPSVSEPSIWGIDKRETDVDCA